MSLKSFHKNYFNFSRAERLGVLFLCGCVLLTLLFRWSLSFRTKSLPPDVAAFAEEIALFRRAVDSLLLAKGVSEAPVDLQSTPDLFFFDPNRATDGEWERLGLNERQIRNIRNYQASGGHFRRKEDLQRLYTISAVKYQQLEPYIRIAANEPSAKQVIPEKQSLSETRDTERTIATLPRETLLQIELNTADSSLLTQLPGIGPVLAARTVRYRNLIGGFTDVAQLSEVYGVNWELVAQLTTRLTADSSYIRKIPVNKATYRELIVHPYMNEQQARGILNYRNLQNRINSLDELVRNNILKREDAEKIKPYVTFE